jgi:hypothetical protein
VQALPVPCMCCPGASGACKTLQTCPFVVSLLVTFGQLVLAGKCEAACLTTSLDLHGVCQRLQRAGHPVITSCDPGRYLCNVSGPPCLCIKQPCSGDVSTSVRCSCVLCSGCTSGRPSLQQSAMGPAVLQLVVAAAVALGPGCSACSCMSLHWRPCP